MGGEQVAVERWDPLSVALHIDIDMLSFHTQRRIKKSKKKNETPRPTQSDLHACKTTKENTQDLLAVIFIYASQLFGGCHGIMDHHHHLHSSFTVCF